MTGQRGEQGWQWSTTDVLEGYLTPERVGRIDQVLFDRITSVTAVFEDVFDPHNVAACVRTCEGYGLQDLHWITNKHGVRLQSTVAKSADNWVTLHHHTSTAAGVAQLKAQGFEVWVSDLQAEHTLDELPIERPVALVVGNAKDGISDQMRAAADRRYILPMWGMVQSFNLSVALAVSLDHVMRQRRQQLGGHGDLPADRAWQLRRRWLEYGVRHAETIRTHHGDLDTSHRG